MKKLILSLAISLAPLYALAIPTVDLDGLKVFNLNNLSETRYKIYGHSSGTYAAGICRIIIRSNSNAYFSDLAPKFKFIYGGIDGEKEVKPTITHYALMFELMKKTDFAYDYIILETKDGRSIGENIKEVLGDKQVAAIAGTCYSPPPSLHKAQL